MTTKERKIDVKEDLVLPAVPQLQSDHWAVGGIWCHHPGTHWEPQLSPPAPSDNDASHPNIHPHRAERKPQWCGHATAPWRLDPVCTVQSPEEKKE